MNKPPVATEDSYSVERGGILSVAPPGVLGNDTDPEGDALTAKLVTPVKYGTLVLTADGSFTYAHHGGETTGDSFTYRANDGTQDSNIVAVTIAITPTLLIGDVKEDGTVDAIDLLLVTAALGTAGDIDADVDGSGVVDLLDLVLVGFYFRR